MTLVRSGLSLLLGCSVALAGISMTGCSPASQAEATATTISASASSSQAQAAETASKSADASASGSASGTDAALSFVATTSYRSDSRSSSSDKGDSGSFSNSDDTVSASVVPGSVSRPQTSLKDGTYYASGQGKAGDVPVTVVIEGGLITRITLGENNEAPAMAEKAQATVVPEIIAEQTTDVDTATGATTTSQAIIDAVSQVIERAQR